MNDGITVDANVMSGFTDNLIHGTSSDHSQLVDFVRKHHGFAVDVQGRMEHQWLETCKSPVFGEWLVLRLREGVVRKVAADLHRDHKKRLRIDCGMPLKRFEIAYVEVAAVTDSKYIVTEDIDFWEPEAKTKDAKTKAKIRAERRGKVCKYLSKCLNVKVATPSMALAELTTD